MIDLPQSTSVAWKPYLLIIIGLLHWGLIFPHAFAQETDQKPRFMIGPTGGVNFCSVVFQPTIQQVPKLGYDAGVIFRYDVTKFAGVWVEIDYSKRGWKEVNEKVPGYAYMRELSFVNVPIMTHFMVGNSSFKPTIDMGASFGYYLGEHGTTLLPDGKKKVKIPMAHHDTPIQNKLFWGVGGGVGLEYHSAHIVVGLRGSYTYGFGDLFHNARTDTFVKSSEQIISTKAYVLYAF